MLISFSRAVFLMKHPLILLRNVLVLLKLLMYSWFERLHGNATRAIVHRNDIGALYWNFPGKILSITWCLSPPEAQFDVIRVTTNTSRKSVVVCLAFLTVQIDEYNERGKSGERPTIRSNAMLQSVLSPSLKKVSSVCWSVTWLRNCSLRCASLLGLVRWGFPNKYLIQLIL